MHASQITHSRQRRTPKLFSVPPCGLAPVRRSKAQEFLERIAIIAVAFIVVVVIVSACAGHWVWQGN
jgi:hypothetical protein